MSLQEGGMDGPGGFCLNAHTTGVTAALYSCPNTTCWLPCVPVSPPQTLHAGLVLFSCLGGLALLTISAVSTYQVVDEKSNNTQGVTGPWLSSALGAGW